MTCHDCVDAKVYPYDTRYEKVHGGRIGKLPPQCQTCNETIVEFCHQLSLSIIIPWASEFYMSIRRPAAAPSHPDQPWNLPPSLTALGMDLSQLKEHL